jgi:FkbM family methyltransferase
MRIPESPANRFQEFFQMKQLLDELRINLVLDVGANTGQYASDVRALGYSGMIFSFEPVERSYERLRGAFRDDPQWQGRQVALGDKAGEMTMNVIPDLTEMSSLLQPRGSWPSIVEESVQVRRLDELFDEIAAGVPDPRAFLKMDTQGYDLRVFEGAAGCLERVHGLESELSVRPLYEGMRSYTEALATYDAAGFILAHVSVVSRDSDGELAELNCFMKRVDQRDA